MKRIDMYISERQDEHLRKEAEQKGLSFSEIVRRILDAYCFGERIKHTQFDKVNSEDN